MNSNLKKGKLQRGNARSNNDVETNKTYSNGAQEKAASRRTGGPKNRYFSEEIALQLDNGFFVRIVWIGQASANPSRCCCRRSLDKPS